MHDYLPKSKSTETKITVPMNLKDKLLIEKKRVTRTSEKPNENSAKKIRQPVPVKEEEEDSVCD